MEIGKQNSLGGKQVANSKPRDLKEYFYEKEHRIRIAAHKGHETFLRLKTDGVKEKEVNVQ